MAFAHRRASRASTSPAQHSQHQQHRQQHRQQHQQPGDSSIAALTVPQRRLSQVASLTGQEEIFSELRKLRIMLVDDDVQFSEQLLQLGRDQGFVIQAFTSGEVPEPGECVKRFDAVLLACHLVDEEQKCLELARDLKAQQSNFPMILMSTNKKTRLPRLLQNLETCTAVRKYDGVAHILTELMHCVEKVGKR